MNTEILLIWIMALLGIIEIVIVIVYTANYFAVKKLTKAILGMNVYAEKYERKLDAMGSGIKSIGNNIASLDMIKQGNIKLTAKSSVFGDVEVNLDLSKILGEKKDEQH